MARAKKPTKKKTTKKAKPPKETNEVSETLKNTNDSENTEEKKGPDDNTSDDPEEISENTGESENQFSNLEEIGIFEDRDELVSEDISEVPENVVIVDDPEEISEDPEDDSDFDDSEENEETELKPVNLELDGIMVLVSYLLTIYVFYRLKNLEKATVLTKEIEQEYERVLKGIGERLKKLIEKYSQRSKLINGIASNLEELVFFMDMVTLANSLEIKIQAELKKPGIEVPENADSVELIESEKTSPEDVNESLKQMVSKTKVTA
ncbi:hypothetical protein HNP86_001715 [Methanococcus maripaludis]|uniref:Uncharacterized protein n=1 Tax=Methanococcus maripaludis TaxID=39152 RepID=A0A7J9NV54_METMI|nr:hypothetical protein [Methanococcus maripaludis]MBA2851562.1 hypothetical protein [Methanococcus maripaludis]